jgi:hypothetical protein
MMIVTMGIQCGSQGHIGITMPQSVVFSPQNRRESARAAVEKSLRFRNIFFFLSSTSPAIIIITVQETAGSDLGTPNPAWAFRKRRTSTKL